MSDVSKPAMKGHAQSPLVGRIVDLLSRSFIFVILVTVILIFALISLPGTFLTFVNFRNIVIDAASLSLLAVGMTFIIIARQIDLSVGAVLIFSAVVGSLVCVGVSKSPEEVARGLYPTLGIGILAEALSAIAAGALWGWINGALVAWARIPSFVVTLGTLAAALGLAQIISGGVNVRYVPLEVQAGSAGGSSGGCPPLSGWPVWSRWSWGWCWGLHGSAATSMPWGPMRRRPAG